MHVRDAEPRGELMEHRQVLLKTAVRPHEEQAGLRVEMALVRVEVPDDIFNPLVRNDASDEQDVRPIVVILPRNEVVWRQVEMRKIRNDGQHTSRVETQRLELLPVELRVAEREIHACRVDAQLAPALEALLHQLLMYAREELGRCDVVVHENLAI